MSLENKWGKFSLFNKYVGKTGHMQKNETWPQFYTKHNN